MGWYVIICVVAAVHAASSANEYLLPGDVVPTHYDLRLAYDIDPRTNFSYVGVAKITLLAKRSTSKIILHAQGFSISEGDVTVTGASSPAVQGARINDTFNFLTLQLSEELRESEEYILTIPFYGNLEKGLDGVYVSSYVTRDTNNVEYLITTQFEAISARKGFPCFDEPIYKATFAINIGHHEDYTAVSNMPIASSSKDNALEEYWSWLIIGEKFRKDKSMFVWDQFATSVPMSTYLVAFVVSTFAHVDSSPELSTTKFRIWARPDAIDQAAYAASIGPKVLSHFERYFNVSFPLPKQDMVAIPDFSAGAMENWGLITYRETALLYDRRESSFMNKERVAEVIAHELAHQWFGNLVTMKWWSDLWLNEGFATFVASVGVSAVEPSWHADQLYSVDNALPVLTLDALQTSHAVSVDIDNPKKIAEIFDEISYRKGSSLIRMMSMFLGEDLFRQALHNYLVKHSYGNAEQDDLWAELTAVVQERGELTRNVSVKQIMDTWTKQTGYPLLTVTRDYTDKTLTVSQRRFLSLGSAARGASSWWVPLSVLCEPDERRPQLQWLADREGVASQHKFEHGAGHNQWVLFNYDMIAPYRVNYDARNWQLLSQALRSSGLARVPVLARVQLLTDAFTLAWRGQLPYATALQLASYLTQEQEFLPLSTGLRALAKIGNVLKRSPDYGAYQKYVRKLIGGAYRRAGGLAAKTILHGDDLTSVKMQVTTSQWACKMKVPDCEENAIELYRRWMEADNPDDNNPIPLDLRRTVYCVGIARGSVREWRFALARRRAARSAAARQQLLLALTCAQDVWILAQYLEWTITDGSEVRRQDSRTVITAITSTPGGYYVARDFIYTRIQDIHRAFHGQERSIGHIIKTLLGQFTTQKELDEFLAWKEQNAKYLEDAPLAVAQGIENAQVNIAWVSNYRKTVVDKLREYSSDFLDYVDVPLKANMLSEARKPTITKLCLVLMIPFLLINLIDIFCT